MQNKLSTSTNPRTARLRSALIMSVVLLFLLLQVTSLSYAVPQKSKKGTFGTIRLMAIPDGSPIRIDGLPVGKTTELPRLLDLAPGLHTLEIRFPNNQRWTRKIKVVSEQTVCIDLSYRPGPPPGSDPEPTPSSEASNPQPTSSPAARSLSGGESFDLTFSDGSRLAGTIGGCGLTGVPRALPGSKKTIRKTRRTN
jgi:hypothetical protein